MALPTGAPPNPLDMQKEAKAKQKPVPPRKPQKPYASESREEDLMPGESRSMLKKFAKGGGIESKGKTQGKTVKMARGGGIESKGKTRGRVC